MKRTILFTLIAITLFLVFGSEVRADGYMGHENRPLEENFAVHVFIILVAILGMMIVCRFGKCLAALYRIYKYGTEQEPEEKRPQLYPLIAGRVTAIELQSGASEVPDRRINIQVKFEDGREAEIELDKAKKRYFWVGRRIGGRFRGEKLFALRARPPEQK